MLQTSGCLEKIAIWKVFAKLFFIAGLTAPSQHASDQADCIDTLPTFSTGWACRTVLQTLQQPAADSSLSPSPCLPTVISTITRTGSLLALAFSPPQAPLSPPCSPSQCSPDQTPALCLGWPPATASAVMWTASPASTLHTTGSTTGTVQLQMTIWAFMAFFYLHKISENCLFCLFTGLM